MKNEKKQPYIDFDYAKKKKKMNPWSNLLENVLTLS